MKKSLLLLLLVLLTAGYAAALIWSGGTFYSYVFPSHPLSLEKMPPLQVDLGQPVTLELNGSGFNTRTRVSLQMDVDNREAIVGTFPLDGYVNDMLVIGDDLYLANTLTGIQRLDISNPLRPEMVQSASRLSALDLEQDGDLLYLSCGTQGVRVYERLPSGRLVHRNSYYTFAAAVESKAGDHYLYVAAGQKGVQVFRKGKHANSQPVGTIADGYMVTGLDLYQNYLYLATRKDGIQIYRLNEDGRPLQVGSLSAIDNTRDLVVEGRSLYVMEREEVVHYSLENPEHPEPLGRSRHVGGPRNLHIAGEEVFVASKSGLGLVEFQEALAEKALNLNPSPRAIAQVGEYLYAAVPPEGIVIVDAKRILPRHTAYSLETDRVVRDLYRQGRHLFIADGAGGLFFSALDHPTVEPEKLIQAEVLAITGDGNRLFVTGKNGVRIYHTAELPAIKPLALWPEVTKGSSLALFGNTLVVGQGSAGLTLFDLRNLNAPQVIDRLPKLHVFALQAAADYLYVGVKDGVRIYRQSVAGKLELVSELRIPFPHSQFAEALALAVEDSYLYVALGAGGMLIADIKDPLKPKIIATKALPGVTSSIQVLGERVYLANRFGGFQIIDARNKKVPRLISSSKLHGLSKGIQVVDDLIYLGEGTSGVIVIEHPKPATSVKVMSADKLRLQLPSPGRPGRYSIQVSNGEEVQTLNGVLEYGAAGGERQKL